MNKELVSKTKNELIRELVDILVQAGRISGADRAYDAVRARESLGSTGLEGGVAVPHAKTDAVVEGIHSGTLILPQRERSSVS